VGSDAVELLADAVQAVGLEVDRAPDTPDRQVDAVLVNPSGGRVAVELQKVSLVTADGLARRIADCERTSTGGWIRVLVADRVTEQARVLLNEAGWGWLDLRGHLRVVGSGLFVDTDVPAVTRPGAPAAPLTGRVALEVAAELLLAPDQPMTVRATARLLGRSPSSISHVLAGLRAAGLLAASGRPVVPELFWELAERWHPSEVDIQRLPAGDDRAVLDALRVGLGTVEGTVGWAMGDTMAAARYGAALSGVRTDYPPDLYVPDDVTLQRAVRVLGAAGDHAGRAATLRVAPVPAVCAHRVGVATEFWPLTSPLFVALDLARDPGRGREILAGWTPDTPWHRVW
jgi:hypothetical protein